MAEFSEWLKTHRDAAPTTHGRNESIEIHEYKNKKKALHARDKFRQMETVESAKMIMGCVPGVNRISTLG